MQITMNFFILTSMLFLALRTIAAPVPLPMAPEPPALLVRSATPDDPGTIGNNDPCDLIRNPSCPKHKSGGSSPPALLVRSVSGIAAPAPETIGGHSSPCDLIEHPHGCKHPDPNPPAVVVRSASANAAPAPAPAPDPQTIGNGEPCNLNKPANCKHPDPPA